MEENNTAMQRFFAACDDLLQSKHFFAEKKIETLMRSIAECGELMALFSQLTRNFHYEAAKRLYLKEPRETRTARGAAYLPADESELLAFVFCLLMEIDTQEVKLPDLLLRYFYVDGSLTASYALFVQQVIRPFRDVVRRCFPDAGKWGDPSMQRKKEDGILQAISEKLAAERANLPRQKLSEEDFRGGGVMLAEMKIAIDRRDIPELKALLCGYYYFLRNTRTTSQSSSEMFMLAQEL